MGMNRALFPLLSVAFSLVSAGSAGAATFTVSPATRGASDSGCRPCRTIGGAIIKAGALSGTDRINVAAGTYTERLGLAPTNTVILTGLGAVTVLNSNTGYSPALTMESNSTVRNIGFKVGGTIGVEIFAGRLEAVRVNMTRGSGSEAGIYVRDGGSAQAVISSTTVQMQNNDRANYGLYAESDTQQVVVDRSSFYGGYAVDLVGNGPVSINRAKIYGSIYGINVDGAGNKSITNSLLVAGTTGSGPATSYGTGVNINGPSSADVFLGSSTLVGHGSTASPGNYGIDVWRSGASYVTLTATRVAFAGFQTVMRARLDTGSFSDIRTTVTDSFMEIPSFDFDRSLRTPVTTNLYLFPDPGFRNAAAGDYRLQPTSTMVDRSSAAIANDAADIRGGGRPRNGDGTRTPDLDIGAFEYQPAPGISRAPSVVGRAQVGRVVRCAAGTWSGGPVTYGYQWFRGARPLRGGTRTTYRLQRADRRSLVKCTVKATSLDGVPRTASSRAVRVR